MGTYPEFIKHGEEILDFLDVHGVLKLKYMEKFFPGSRKIIDYLTKKKRLHNSTDGIHISNDPAAIPDKRYGAALGVLADIYDKVKGCAKATEPAQISFVTHMGDYYEIIYVGYGMEAIVTATLESQLAIKMQSVDSNCCVKRIVIIEDKNQMERLQIQQTMRYALVSSDGSLSYFKAGS